MKRLGRLCERTLIGAMTGAFLAATPILRAEDPLDAVEDRLAVSAFGDDLRAQVSGTLDLEEYRAEAPAPGLVVTDGGAALFVPRLTSFVDAQVGRRVYVFVQSRIDRGFDPGYEGRLGIRLDEYALRFTPSDADRFSVQVGKFATVVGNWTRRHQSWDNPFVTPPLPYDTLTGVWDAVALGSASTLLRWAHVVPYSPAVDDSDKRLRLPIVWGPSYGTGAAVVGDLGLLQFAVEAKNVSLSARPDTWSPAQTRWRHPTFSGRLGLRPDEAWNIGLSASAGPYLRPLAASTVPEGRGIGRYREFVLGEDASYAWHRFQVWAEAYEARFEIPAVANADTLAYYVEARVRFAPQLFGAVRWNQQLYGTVPIPGGAAGWGGTIRRIDIAPEYRFTAHVQLKIQGSIEEGVPGSRGAAALGATQLTVRF